MKHRLLIFIRFVYLFICCFFLFVIPAHAYIDPSVMTYAIQAIAGIAIALGAFFGIYWRKFRKVLSKHIDFSRFQNTTVESDDLVFHDPKTGTDIIPASVSIPEEQPKPVKVSFFRDMIPAFYLSVAVAYMLAIFAPLELYFTNSSDFWFGFTSMLPGLLLAFLGIAAVLVIIFTAGRLLYRGLYNLLLCIGLASFIAAYLQGNFFSRQLPPLDGTEFDWSAYNHLIFHSAVLWAVIFVLVVLLVRFIHMQGIKKTVRAVSVFITLILTATLVIVGISHPEGFQKKGVFVSIDGRTSVSQNQNFIIFLLDAVDSSTARTIMEEQPDLYNSAFEDFTYYPNTEGAYTYTQYSLPYILSGIWNENQEEFASFETKAIDASDLFSRLRNENWNIGLYTDDLTTFYQSDRVFEFSNVIDTGTHIAFSSLWRFIKVELELVWFKYAPYGAKQFVDISIQEFENLKQDVDGYIPTTFNHSNVQLGENLNESGLSVESDGNYFRFIHLDGAHVPFNTTVDLRFVPGEDTDYETEVESSLNIAALYIEKLKESGQYDNTSIVILADHGYDMGVGGENVVQRQNPLLMIKGYNEHHDFTVSEAPISFEDLQEAYQRLLDGQTGQDIFDAKDGDQRNRRFLGYIYLEEYHLTEYVQEGYASDKSTLKKTGRYFDLEQ